VLITAREALHPLFALSSPSPSLLTAIGLVLLLYAGTLVLEARREPPLRYALLTAAALDAGWIVGSVIVLLLAWPSLAPAGRALIIAAALIVEVFAFLSTGRHEGPDRSQLRRPTYDDRAQCRSRHPDRLRNHHVTPMQPQHGVLAFHDGAIEHQRFHLRSVFRPDLEAERIALLAGIRRVMDVGGRTEDQRPEAGSSDRPPPEQDDR